MTQQVEVTSLVLSPYCGSTLFPSYFNNHPGIIFIVKLGIMMFMHIVYAILDDFAYRKRDCVDNI